MADKVDLMEKAGGNDPRVTVLQEWKMDAGKAMTQRRMEDKERRTVVRRQQAGTAALGEREQNYGNKMGGKRIIEWKLPVKVVFLHRLKRIVTEI